MQDITIENICRLNGIIDSSKICAVVSHVHPDGDALGSSLALADYLRSLGKTVTPFYPTAIPESLLFLAEGETPVIAEDDPEKAGSLINGCDTIFCLDFNSFKRTDCLEAYLNESKAVKVLIDHHLMPQRECFDLSFSETQISSASEYLYHILMALPQIDGDTGKLPGKSAYRLLTGMTTDSNNFANSVYPSTLSMASQLIAAGVDRDDILSNIYNKYDENRFRLMGYYLSELMTITDDGVAFAVLDKNTLERYDIQEGDTESFVNIPLGMKKVRMSIFLKEMEDRFRVSIRSKKGTSANLCAKEYFHGGGHEQAAGGRLDKPADVYDAKGAIEYIIEKTRQFFSERK